MTTYLHAGSHFSLNTVFTCVDCYKVDEMAQSKLRFKFSKKIKSTTNFQKFVGVLRPSLLNYWYLSKSPKETSKVMLLL